MPNSNLNRSIPNLSKSNRVESRSTPPVEPKKLQQSPIPPQPLSSNTNMTSTFFQSLPFSPNVFPSPFIDMSSTQALIALVSGS